MILYKTKGIVRRGMLVLLAVLPFGTLSAHSGAANNAAWDACDNKPRSTACEYTGFHGEQYRGTCQLIAEHMMCVRNQPIEKPKISPKDE